MKTATVILSYVLCAVASVLWWRVHVIQFGFISVRHFTPEEVAAIYTAAVVSTILFYATIYSLHMRGRPKE